MDALTVGYLGLRHSGRKHEGALQLIKKTGLEPKEINSKVKQYSQLLSIKTLAEYEDRLMRRNDAEKAKKNCERIHSWVKENLQ